MKKNWTKIAIALGPVMMIASVVWEYARTNPEYNFLVEPWAIRGYESDHGVVYVTAAVILLVGGLVTAWEGALKNAVSAAIAAYFVVAATVFAFVFADSEITFAMTFVANALFSFIIAASLSMSLRSLLGENVRLFKRALPVGILVFAVFFLLFSVTLQGNSYTFRPWVLVLFVSLLFGALSVAIRPINMAANRMLILGSVGAWAVVLLSAGALRETLIRIQETTVQSNGAIGVAAQYKDTQAASGWWLAGLGTTVLFVGAVGLWAKRRDIVAAMARARKQREAAEISAKEIADAAEAYAAEQAAKTGS